jgi:transcriptional regulator with XRE-family HTH domain
LGALGEMLRDAREARGASLAEAERDTKIRAKYLAALENDNPAGLPGPVYVRGFLRNYAHYLGIDPDQAVELFEEQSQPTREKIRVARGERPPEKRRPDMEKISIHPLSPTPVDTRVRYGSQYIAVSLVAVPLIILFYFIYSVWGGPRSTNVPIQTPRPPTLTPIALPTEIPSAAGGGAFNTPTVGLAVPPGEIPTPTATLPPSPVAPPPADQVTVKIVTSRDAWMRVLVDGVQQFSGTLPSGTTREWTGKDRVRIRTGRADSVTVAVNGADRGLMTVGTSLIVEKEWDRAGTERLIR